MKKFFSVIMLFVMVFMLPACSCSTIKGSIVELSELGNAELDIMPQKMLEQINIGDTVIVKFGDFCEEMPFVDELIAEDGKLQLFFDRDKWSISICIFNEGFIDKYAVEVEDRVEIHKK